MNRYAYLVEDPRPDLVQDSRLWVMLLRLTVSLPNRDTSYILSHRLWSLRYAGTVIKRTHLASKFEPLLENSGGMWSSIDEFEEIKRTHLASYANEIKSLLDKLP